MKAKELSQINDTVRKMINEHLEKTGMSLNQFAYRSKIHQSQLWMYLNSKDKYGLHSSTLEKIGLYLTNFENQEK